MATATLTIGFNGVQFDVVDHNGQPWLQARQIGQALGYSRPDAVLNIYDRNKDEFSLDMTATIELMVGLTPQTTRIFSLRGCHLIAMFARTSIAKAFRVWVLDVLETLNRAEQVKPSLDTTSRLSRRTDPERKALTAIINTWVSMAPVHYAAARVQVNSHFGVASVDNLTVEQVKEAIKWVQAKIDELPKSLPEPAAPAPALAPLDDSQERMIRAKAEEMRKLMWKAGNVMRELRGIVIAEHARVRPNDFDSMLITNDLHEANEKAFRAFESLADTIAYNVMAIRKMVKARV